MFFFVIFTSQVAENLPSAHNDEFSSKLFSEPWHLLLSTIETYNKNLYMRKYWMIKSNLMLYRNLVKN